MDDVDDAVLLKVKFKFHSPVLGALIDKAIEKEIEVITFEQYKELQNIVGVKVKDEEKGAVIGSGWFPDTDIGIDEFIVVSMSELEKEIKKGNLGMWELELASRIGSILCRKYEPHCFNTDYISEKYFKCAYLDALTYLIALQLLGRFEEERKNGDFVFNGKPITLFDFFHGYGVPKTFFRDCNKCKYVEKSGAEKCPKEREVKVIVKGIEKILEEEYLKSMKKLAE